MWDVIVVWRSELVTLITLCISWVAFRYLLKKSFWKIWWPGALIGLANEFMTEPEWTYSMAIYIWRDISPFVIIGWGITFAWLIIASDALFLKLYGKVSGESEPKDLRLMITDLIIGIPMFLGNELLGLHVLKVWKYNSILEWNTMIPIINYPLEGFISMIFFILAVPAIVRYWRGL